MSIIKVRLQEAWDWGGLSTKQLATRTWGAMDKHDTFNQAAVIAFYAMLSLVPMLGFVLLIALGTRTAVADELLRVSYQLPGQAGDIVRDQVHKIQTSAPVGVLSLSAVVLLWSASSLFVAVMDMLNVVYGVKDGRPWWKRRLMAIVLTLCEVILLVGASVVAVGGPHYIDSLGLGWWGSVGATVVQWLIVIFALLLAFALAYFFGPHIEQTWEWITPGSTIGVIGLILISLGFRAYLLIGFNSEAYGALAGVVLMLLWLYATSLALLVGAEVNCVIEQAAPHGRAPGQKALPA